MEEGVPALLDLLARLSAKATFFLSFGPDNSGKAVYHLLRNPRFLLKMIRTNAPALYGVKTALYGTLLPAPLIAKALPGLSREIEAAGHEVELHAWDHRGWQDGLPRKGAAWVRDWLDRGLAAYQECLGHPPRSFGSPGWVLTETALAVLSGYRWSYLSCTRAPAPFVHAGTGLIEIPSDLPCLEEAGGEKGRGRIMERIAAGGTHVLPVHAEAEGTVWQGAFVAMIGAPLRDGAPPGPGLPLRRVAVVPPGPRPRRGPVKHYRNAAVWIRMCGTMREKEAL
jgi:undecaprenyl phosphate-alpha-L-ara4FN deformylase